MFHDAIREYFLYAVPLSRRLSIVYKLEASHRHSMIISNSNLYCSFFVCLAGGRSESDSASSDTNIPIERLTPQLPKPRQFYKWKLFKTLPAIKIWLDRLSLLALLDRCATNEYP